MICIAKPGFDLCCQRMVILSGKADLPAWREAKHAAMLGAPVVTGSGHLTQLNPSIALLSHVMHKLNTARSKVRFFSASLGSGLPQSPKNSRCVFCLGGGLDENLQG